MTHEIDWPTALVLLGFFALIYGMVKAVLGGTPVSDAKIRRDMARLMIGECNAILQSLMEAREEPIPRNIRYGLEEITNVRLTYWNKVEYQAILEYNCEDVE